MFALRHSAWFAVGLVGAALSTGCQSTRFVNPLTAARENIQLRQANRQCQDQLAQLQARVKALNEDNEELHRLLAQEQLEVRRLRSQVASRSGGQSAAGSAATAARPQLPWESSAARPGVELAARSPLPPASAGSGSPPKAFRPANRTPAGGSWRSASEADSAVTSVRARSSYSGASIPLVKIPGADVERDGNVVRIRITSVPLFDPGKATLRPEAIAELRKVARVLKEEYRDYVIGIEGHTDADPIRKSGWGSNHELAVERALAVFDYLTKREGIPTSRLFIAGFGPIRPIASNSTPAGKARNRRVEFVIYPPELLTASR